MSKFWHGPKLIEIKKMVTSRSWNIDEELRSTYHGRG